MMNPSSVRHTHHILFNRFGRSYRTRMNRQSPIPNCNIEVDKSSSVKSEFYIYIPEEQSEDISIKDLFKEYAGIEDDTLLSLIEGDIKKIIKEYYSDLKYDIDYDIDPEEPIPYLVIKLTNRLPIDEEINFLKHIWKSMREKGHKDFLRKVTIVVDYD